MDIKEQLMIACANDELGKLISEYEVMYDGEVHFTLSKVESEVINNYCFLVGHANISTSKYNHRYFFLCLEHNTVIYTGSNVIGNIHFYSLTHCKSVVKNYFKVKSASLNKLVKIDVSELN